MPFALKHWFVDCFLALLGQHLFSPMVQLFLKLQISNIFLAIRRSEP